MEKKAVDIFSKSVSLIRKVVVFLQERKRKGKCNDLYISQFLGLDEAMGLGKGSEISCAEKREKRRRNVN